LKLAGYAVLECRPRPWSEEGQSEQYLANRLHFPRGRVTSFLAAMARNAGRLMGWQGETVYAVARRQD
jgi:hypothetical protein